LIKFFIMPLRDQLHGGNQMMKYGGLI
jgi:hypothetical protein